MRVLYDGVIYSHQAAGGINRYFANVIGLLPEEVTPILISTHRRSTNFPAHPNLELHLRSWRLPKMLGKVRRALQRTYFRRLAATISADVLHPTYYRTLSGSEFDTSGPPQVLTVHDMTHERFAAMIDRRGKHAAEKRTAINRADAIICVSDYTRNDLLDLYPHVEDRVSVIHQATEMDQVKPDDWSPADERPFFLFVGARGSYKNFDRLLEALGLLKKKRSDVQLHTVGSPLKQAETARIESLGLSDQVVDHGLVSDARLSSLYRHCAAFVYPSLYEGFGIPLLEAMGCGAPILASNVSSIPEVTEDAALLFNPESVEEIEERMTQILDDTRLREDLIERGHRRRSVFSWQATAEETLAVYRRLT